MAYSRRGNPDSLPAHIEPEQAAQMLAPKRGPRDDYQPTRVPVDDRYRQSAPRRNDSYNDSRQPSGPTGRRDVYARPENSRDDRGARYDDRDRERERDRGYASAGSGGGRAAPQRAGEGRERDALWSMFRAVDRDGSGMLSEQELGNALVNGDYTQFDPHTVKMMIRMFDVDRSGTIDFEEFCGLWGFLSEWRKLFNRFDVDKSGHIDYKEFTAALVAFGYRLSAEYISLLFDTYDTRGRGVLSFDLFVQSCISLKRMTDVFKRYDQDRDGFITLSFEQFLTEAIRQK